MTDDEPASRRSGEWTDQVGMEGFQRRTAFKSLGLRDTDYGRSIIAIGTNESDFTRCHRHFDQLVAAVRDGVLEAGGLPRIFNTMPMAADMTRPVGDTFMHRNLLSMEVEETARVYPIDGMVLLGACDETIPGMLMAAASIDLPTLFIPGGPALTGFWQGRQVGIGFDCQRAFDALARCEVSDADITDLEAAVEPSSGHCSTLGTASTMAVAVEALGMAPVGSAAIPAVDARRVAMARDAGVQAMRLVAADLRPSQIMTEAAFANAIRALVAIDGATNAVTHLIAVAGRLGITLPLERFDRISAETPVLLSMRPMGEHYMSDLYRAGGVPALLDSLRPLLDLETVTVTGETLGEAIRGARSTDPTVIGSLDQPIAPPRGVAVLRGNLAPDGALVRLGTASPELMVHRGRAVVFDGLADFEARVNDPALEWEADDVIVLRGEGPRGSIGMSGTGLIPIPDKLVEAGVTDLVRITDWRMGGTVGGGTAVIHVAPESAVGGPLGLVETGDIVVLDIPARTVSVELSDAELEARRSTAGRAPYATTPPVRGFARLYAESVLQINEGCDFDFLVPPKGRSAAAPRRPPAPPRRSGAPTRAAALPRAR
ncbi:MAG TPA: dihydroxy-acid dehydratase [Nocardioides bacterium]|nr:dihydroxy-acid dehydratase [Nocardioides sp.]